MGSPPMGVADAGATGAETATAGLATAGVGAGAAGWPQFPNGGGLPSLKRGATD